MAPLIAASAEPYFDSFIACVATLSCAAAMARCASSFVFACLSALCSSARVSYACFAFV